jgi:hypothetical protein
MAQFGGPDRRFLAELDRSTAEQIADRARTVFGVSPTVAELTGARSVGDLAALVVAAMSTPDRTTSSGASEPAKTADAASLSSSQRRIWFMHQLAAGAPLYNIATRLELTGPLVADALRSALTDVLARHDVLRTRYPVRAGVPRAEVLPPATLRLPLVDLSGGPATDAEVDRLADEQACRPFDLDRDLPARFLLIRRAPRCHVLVGTFHHIAVDWLTLNLLVREIGDRYAAHTAATSGAGTAIPADPPALRYSDVVRHESSAAALNEMRRAAAARCADLRDVPSPRLPTDFARPRYPRFGGAAVTGLLDERLVAGVRELARQCRVTPFAVLLAALAVLLGRAGGQGEMVIGTPAAGRTRIEWQEVVGCFVNVVPVHLRLTGASSTADLVSHAGEATWQSLEAQHVPFDELVRAMRRRRDDPLVNVLFSYQGNAPAVPFTGLADAAWTVSRAPGTAKYDLSLYTVGRGPQLRLELEYDTDLYTAETAAAVLHAYHDELVTMVENPHGRVDLDGRSGFEAAARRARAHSEEPQGAAL